MKYTVPPKEDGMTVKELLSGSIGLSVSFIRHLKFIENGIMLNGEKVTVRKTVCAGDILLLATENEKEGSRLTPTDVPLDIIYEDEDIVVPSKPADMPTHPSRNHYGDTLADALAYRYKNDDEPFVFRPVNRLDRNTSGLTLIARNRISASKLSDAMKRGEIHKQYIALLRGVPNEDCGRVEGYIKRTDESIIMRQVCEKDQGGDYALTLYRTLISNGEYSVVLATPKTGRTHQLRVHFASIGCAISGDDMYGEKSELIPRHALHAAALSFPLPRNGKPLLLFAPIPEDMRKAIYGIFGKDAKSIINNPEDFTDFL